MYRGGEAAAKAAAAKRAEAKRKATARKDKRRAETPEQTKARMMLETFRTYTTKYLSTLAVLQTMEPGTPEYTMQLHICTTWSVRETMQCMKIRDALHAKLTSGAICTQILNDPEI